MRPSRAIVRPSRIKTALKWLLQPKTCFLNSQFTRQVARRYCTGRGCEIGPGLNPQAPVSRTCYVDRFTEYGGRSIATDVIADAAVLPFAADSQDYIVCSHVLEHCPDTIAVLLEWQRVLRIGGVLVLRLPHRDRCFDKGRPLTPLEHHIADHEAGDARDDTPHYEEFLRHSVDDYPHKWKGAARLPGGGYDIGYIVRNGHIHYHVWTQDEMVRLLQHCGYGIRLVVDDCLDRDDSFLVVAER